ncbi:hypothetical protein VD0002_g2789 [Verticillium dahliae]|uniref:Secreted protein n=2 Tax=Verticillium dahliae TaxID=27337 RepID=G2XCV8_VERDV|nr:uncharacterized protein VDAG_07990 [Verticillium dahliae VdLs.17]KAF3345586.1 hypothetical protein VdG2_06429 [Verticillium dahliae VDG2]PNH27882.1 hypothetical protein BJF96_g8853 [Verticillium dahliae]EGY16826.1 secreted protein [Verticillium dahliae VdLs.17]PNH55975.1 hypothetical protein VD0003_g1716 [Verticillium dahliae]PNH66626.1 hypothetical protein VD0002_g2789 [Verticillium dahliae]
MALSTLAQSALGEVYGAFQTPPMRARPMFRWWWPDGLVDPEEIRAEVLQMYDAGFGGAEISDVHRSRNTPIDLENYGWGTQPWIDGLYAAVSEADKVGFYIDNTVGPTYPAAVPGLSQDDPAASQEVVLGRAVVTGGERYSGPVPPPDHAPEGDVTKETLLAVHAYKVAAGSSPTANPIILDHTSLISLSCFAANGTVNFTPPDDGTWMILSWHERGSGMKAKGGPHNHEDGAVIDHFSSAGIGAVTNFWDDNLLTPEIKDLLSDIGGAYFEDSIELEYNTIWTPDLREEFKTYQGYDLFRYLPAITQDDQKNVFRFADAELNRGVINDFWDTLGKMYVDNHIDGIKPWANAMNMKFRAQVYGVPTAATTAAGKIDIPEGESLGFKNMGDWRALAGAANFANLTMISNEAGALLNQPYATTWDLMIKIMNPIMTAGVNLQIFHGFSYKEAPGAKWPGFAAFTPYSGNRVGYSESWGPRIPMWKHTRDVADYFARTQSLLQRGSPKHDVAFYSPKGYIAAGFSGPWYSLDGARQGWSMNLIGPGQFEEPTAFVEDGLLHPNGPGFSVLAFEGDSFASRAPVIEVATAEKILDFAKKGLTVVAVGNWTAPRAFGYKEFDQNDKIKAIFDELLALPNVFNPADRPDIPAAMAKAGVKPHVQYDNQQLLNYHRVDGDSDHFFFTATHTDIYEIRANIRVQPVEADVIIPRQSSKGVPFWMNLWTGEITPVANYEEVSDTQLKVRISLSAYQSAMLTVAPSDTTPIYARLAAPAGASLRRTEAGLVLRSNNTGTYDVALSTGESVSAQIDSVIPAQALSNWTLDVEDWRPTDDVFSSETVKVNRTFSLGDGPLVAWPEIEGLEDSVGIGRYSSSFTLDSEWDADVHGAVLAIPTFIGSLRIFVNDEWIGPVDQMGVEFDITAFLEQGKNTVVIEMATNLINRIRTVDPAVYSSMGRQQHGLVGTIEVKPYGVRKLAE